MMKREIKNRWTGAVIHSGEYNTLREAVVYCVEQRIDLSGADLSGADLSGAGKGPYMTG